MASVIDKTHDLESTRKEEPTSEHSSTLKGYVKRLLKRTVLYIAILLVAGIAVGDFVAGLGFAAIALALNFFVFDRIASRLDS